MRRAAGGALAALLLLAAPGCSSEPDPPGAVTADEDRQLNEAAEMLDANSVSTQALNDHADDNWTDQP